MINAVVGVCVCIPAVPALAIHTHALKFAFFERHKIIQDPTQIIISS